MKYLLDTCVLSEFVKPAPNSAVLAWADARAENELFVAAMTLAELRRGVAKLPVSRRKSELLVWLDQLQASLGERILPFTGDTAGYWGELCTQVEAMGKPMAIVTVGGLLYGTLLTLLVVPCIYDLMNCRKTRGLQSR